MRASILIRWARGRPASIRAARLWRRRLFPDRLGGGRWIGSRERVVQFVEEVLFLVILVGGLRWLARAVGIAAARAALCPIHGVLLVEVPGERLL
jgi:hypothetical protein